MIKSKLTFYRILCGAVMAASAAIYCLLMFERSALWTWRAWLPLLLLLLVEFDIYDGIEYFLSGRYFDKPKLFKRVNIVGGFIVLLSGLGGYLNTVCGWNLKVTGLIILPIGALMLIVAGHGLNCFFDSLGYFLHEKDKKWYLTAWSVAKIAAAPVIVLGSVFGAGMALLFMGLTL